MSKGRDRGTTTRRPGATAIVVSSIFLLSDPLVPAVIVVDGGCSLVEAIRAANSDLPEGACPAGFEDDTIVLTVNVTLNAVEEPDEGDNGLPTVTSPITIEAGGHTIERNTDSLVDFRIVKVASAGELVLRNATVSGGAATGADAAGYGGAFLNRQSGGDFAAIAFLGICRRWPVSGLGFTQIL